jgi:hypothetical protein
MKYQDLKIRDAMRLTAIASVSLAVAAAMLIKKQIAQPWLDHMPIMHHNAYSTLLITLPILALMCIGVVIQYFVTTPEQNARYIIKAGRALPPALSDTGNPYYRISTLNYVFARSKSQS